MHPRGRSTWCVKASRVVPAMGETIVRSVPASAFSSVLLPAFGSADEDERRLVPRRLEARGVGDQVFEILQDAAEAGVQFGRGDEGDVFFGKVDARFDQRQRVHERFHDRREPPRQLAGHELASRFQFVGVLGMDRQRHALGGGEIEPAVQEVRGR